MLKNIKQETPSDNNNYIYIAKINSDNLDPLIVNLMKCPSFLTKSDQDHVKKNSREASRDYIKNSLPDCIFIILSLTKENKKKKNP